MAKKGNKPAKASQQRAREEQWKRRLATQGSNEAGAVIVDEPFVEEDSLSQAIPVVQERASTAFTAAGSSTTVIRPTSSATATATAMRGTATPRSAATSTATRATASTSTASSGTAAATQRRALTAARGARTRAAATAMTVDDEMYYVRSDIRRLILLTVACLLVLIVLFFLIPR